MTPPIKTELKPLLVGEEHAGRRLDNFLLSHFKGVPRPRIYRAVQRGEVRVNSARSRPSYRLRNGDRLRLPPLRTPISRRASPSPLTLEVLYEDEELLAVMKPAGVAVHGGSSHDGGAVEGLRAERGEEKYLELAHRLDKDTSGCLLLAKRRPALRDAHRLFRERKIVKCYLALAHGAWPESMTFIDEPLLERRLGKGERWSQVDDRGRSARTEVAVKERLPGADAEGCSLLNLRPRSGRMHQLRAHLAHHGRPIVGDLRYGDAQKDQILRDRGLNRMMLHALSLQFEWRGRAMEIEAPPSRDFQALLAKLRD